jgi:hypothetical protein
MTRIATTVAALVAALLLGLASAQAQWTMSQRTKFLGDCIPACEANQNVPGPMKGQCGMFCNCLANEGEKIFSADDFQEMDDDARAGRDNAKTQRFHGLVPACNQQAFGGQK